MKRSTEKGSRPKNYTLVIGAMVKEQRETSFATRFWRGPIGSPSASSRTTPPQRIHAHLAIQVLADAHGAS